MVMRKKQVNHPRSSARLNNVKIRLSLVIIILFLITFNTSNSVAIAAGVLNLNDPAYYPNLGNPAYSSDNPLYNAGYGGQCTWFVWGRAKEKLGISLPMEDNADNWYSEAQGHFSVGSSPQPNSIAVWAGSANYPAGHVAFVEDVGEDGSGNPAVIINEANFNNYEPTGGGYNGSPELVTINDMATRGPGNLDGYIYLPPGQTGPVITSISPTSQQAGNFILTINGSGFDSEAVPEIYWAADGHFVGNGTVLSQTATKLVAREFMTGAELGTYDVEVDNSDGTMSNEQDFTVTQHDISPGPSLLINSFAVSPNTVAPGNSFTISYSVSDNGGSGLKQVELWRANDSNGNPDPSTWTEIAFNPTSGASASGSFTDAPSAAGVYWYGIHVVDNANTWGHEDSPVKAEVKPANIAPQISVSPSSGLPGTTFVVTGSGFTPNSTATSFLTNHNPRPVSIDGNGDCNYSIISGTFAPGVYQSHLTDESGTSSKPVTFTVVAPQISFAVGVSSYVAYGQSHSMIAAPFISNGRTLVPVRGLVDALAGFPEWDATTQTVKIIKGPTTVKITIGSRTIMVNETAHQMDVAPVIINGRTYLPAGYIAQVFGYSVFWDAATQTVELTGPTPHLSISPNSGTPGTAFVVTGSDFTPNSTATSILTNHNPLNVAIDSNGDYYFAIDSSSFAPGTYQNYLIDRSGAQSNTVSFTVTQPEIAFSLKLTSGYAKVTGHDGAGIPFSQTTDSNGYLPLKGSPGIWTFTVSDWNGLRPFSFSMDFTITGGILSGRLLSGEPSQANVKWEPVG